MSIKKLMENTAFSVAYASAAIILFIISLILFCESGTLPRITAPSAPSLPVGTVKEEAVSKSDGCFIPATGISFDNVRYVRTVPGGTYRIEFSLTPENSNEMLYWRSINPAVATVSQDGVITALSKGESIIIAESYNRKISRSTVIKVGEMPPAILEAPYINQLRDFPNGCESCSTVMALNHVGIDITTEEFIENYLDMSRLPYVNDKGKYVGASPWEYFLGDPRLSTGLCCYAPVIGNALEKFIDPEEYKVTEHYNVPLEDLCRDYITKNIPIIFWGTMYMKEPYLMDWTWQIDGAEDGETFTWVAPMHCLLLVGFDDEYYYFNDPVAGKKVAYTKADTEAAYEGLYKQAVTVEPVK
ncbi:MAG: hypothetical protein E7660_02520 [Ruminococcaceae bacterium]|nr:hypothetical protein [Oscillospiraceae bacterium]